MMPGTDVRAILDELSARTEEELDYRSEADNQRAFSKAFENDPQFMVPRVVASAPKVTVTEWLSATPLSSIITGGSREQRNRAGALLAEFHFSSPMRVGMLHSDPHPGNFMLLDDGRLGVIDFGATAAMPDGFPPVLGRMVRLALDERFDELTELLYDNKFVLPGRTVTDREIAGYLRPFTDPIRTESFHFTRSWLQQVAGVATDFSSPQFRTARTLNLPPEYLSVFRVLLGSVGICAQLDAYAPTCGSSPSGCRGSSTSDRPGRPGVGPRGRPSGSCTHQFLLLVGIADDGMLARTPTWTLTGDDRSAVEDFAAPHSPGLLTVEGGSETPRTHRACGTQFFGTFEVGGRLREPQVRVVFVARQDTGTRSGILLGIVRGGRQNVARHESSFSMVRMKCGANRAEKQEGHGPLGGVRGLEFVIVYRRQTSSRSLATDETAAARARRRAEQPRRLPRRRGQR